jgi:hypothetical protein
MLKPYLMCAKAILINPVLVPGAKKLERAQRVFGLVCALCVTAPQAEVLPVQESPLGTLLYSNAERVGINRARLGLATEAGSAPEVLRQVTVNGIVKRQSGKNTVWLNGQALPDGETLPPIKTLIVTRNGVKLNGQLVRVGETLDLDTKVRADLVLPGAVTHL